MKILHTADWHLGKIINGYSMLDNQIDALNQISLIMVENDIDSIIIAGDIYDRSVPPAEAIKAFEDFVNDTILEKKKKIIIIPGNHDSIERLGFGNKLFKKNNLFIANEIKKEIEYVDIDKMRVFLLPYTNLYKARDKYDEQFKSMNDVYEYLVNQITLDKERFNVIVVHDYVTYNMEKLIESESERDITVGGLEYIDAKIFKEFNYVALGHLHQAQKVGQVNIRYSGSPLKYSFSEVKHKKSVTILDPSGKVTMIPIKAKKDMVVIKGNLDSLVKEDFYKKYNYKNDYFKAILSDEGEVIDAYAKLKSIYPNLMEIYKEKLGDSIKILSKEQVEGKPLHELFSTFYEHVTFTRLDESEEKFVANILKGDFK